MDNRASKRRRLSPERDFDSKRVKPSAATRPFNAPQLGSKDLSRYHSLFALYLDVQKRLDIDSLDSTEVKGRFKSFVGKWNRGELAEGWYDPAMKERSEATSAEPARFQSTEGRSNESRPRHDGSSDDEYGPAVDSRSRTTRSGPTVARLDDLQARDEQRQEDEDLAREDARYERKRERKANKERLEELVPRAEPGTKERQLEKKRETAAANRSFRDRKDDTVEEVGESQLMGEAESGLEGYKAKLHAMQKKKSEREIRKEEALRAREAQRQERVAVHRVKEEKTMEMLRALAQQRYG